MKTSISLGSLLNKTKKMLVLGRQLMGSPIIERVKELSYLPHLNLRLGKLEYHLLLHLLYPSGGTVVWLVVHGLYLSRPRSGQPMDVCRTVN